MAVTTITKNIEADLKAKLEGLLNQYPERYQAEDIWRAFRFAQNAHKGQDRKSGEPFFCHPIRAAITITELKIDTPSVMAALLHDVIEDTPVTLDAIRQEFGDEVAFLVDGVTKLGHFQYRGVEAEVENLRKMMLATAKDIRVILIKLADRLDNMQTIDALEPDRQKRMALETLDIYAPIAHRLGMGDLAGDLEDLAFPLIYPKEYKWLIENVAERYEHRRELLAQLMPIIQAELAKVDIHPTEIHSRIKHLYSLYRKLLRYDMDLEKIHDLVALRIIVKDIEECYKTLGAIHAAWKPLPGRIKDYIALPKPNGYRSLHTTVIGPGGKIVELQIRTSEMHDEAERGIAAHWAYATKKGSRDYADRKVSEIPKELAWVAQLGNWQKEFKGSREFIETLKIDFFKNRIFVITPKGDVIDLPEGSTPVDFAYYVHTDVGNQCAGAKVNGKIVPLDTPLKSSDVIEVLTQKNKKPSEQWLEFVKTSFARNKIRDSLKKKQGAILGPHKQKDIEFLITVGDRVGLIRDISNVFSALGVNIKTLTTRENERYPIIAVKCAMPTDTKPEQLAVRLKKIKNVEAVSYKVK